MNESEHVFLTREEALSLFPKNQKYVHTFLNSVAGILVGGDWEVKYLRKLMKTSKIEIGGPRCKAMKHGLIVWRNYQPVFVECDPAKLEVIEKAKAVQEPI